MAPLERYRNLESALVHVRWVHRGLESAEEDALLDEMEAAWQDLSPEEQALIDAEPPRSLIRSPQQAPRTLAEPEDLVLHSPRGPRVEVEVVPVRQAGRS